MEISSSGKNSVRIKTKNASISIDPEKEQEVDVVIYTHSPTVKSENAKLVIDGPGEYEVGGVSIKGERQGEDLIFEIFDDANKVMVFADTAIKKVKDDDDCDAVIIHVTRSDPSDSLEQLSCDVIAVYGNEEFVPKDSNLKSLPKISLKKKEELKGSVILLS